MPIDHELDMLRTRAAARSAVGRSLSSFMATAQRDLIKRERRLGDVNEAWASVCPAPLLERTAILSLNHGVLRIAVADSAAMYELDRCLRGGGEVELARACQAPVHRVRLALDKRPFQADGET